MTPAVEQALHSLRAVAAESESDRAKLLRAIASTLESALAAAPAGEPTDAENEIWSQGYTAGFRAGNYISPSDENAMDIIRKAAAALAAPAGEPAAIPQGEAVASIVADHARLRAALIKIAAWDDEWGAWPENNPAWGAMAVVAAREAVPEKDKKSSAAAPAGEPRLTELDIVNAAGPYWSGKAIAEVMYGIACAVGPMPAWANAGHSMQRMFELASERVLGLVNIALAAPAAPAGEPAEICGNCEEPLPEGCKGTFLDDGDQCLLNRSPTVAALIAPTNEPDDFDKWLANPYTKVLRKSIAEDYEPKHRDPISAPLKAANLSAVLRAIVRECHGAATRSNSPLAIPSPERPYSIDSYLPPHLLDLAVAALESTETPLQVIEAMRHDDIERAPSYEELRELHREKRP